MSTPVDRDQPEREEPPTREGSPVRQRIGLCLTGGGITGAMYEVGCLAALEEHFEGFAACDFDVFVGTSSGATVAVALAGGIQATRLYRALLDPADDFFPLERNHLLRLDGPEWRRMWSSGFGAARRLFSSVAAQPLDLDFWNELDRFWDSLPAGIFTLDGYERFLMGFMSRRGIALSFDGLERCLRVVASDLDRGERAIFGAGELVDVPIPRAVAAATATPLLFAPVRIDGRDFIQGDPGEVGHADIAAEAGCRTVLLINPLVPVRADLSEKAIPTGHGPGRRVRDKGLLWVNSQAWRLRSARALSDGLARYRQARPDIEVLLIEPDPDDATVFMHSPMNFAARRAILEDGYRRTLAALREEGSPLCAALERAGLRKKAS